MPRLAAILPGIQGVVYGVAIIVIILVAPDGIYWKVRDRIMARRAASAPAPAPLVEAASIAAEAPSAPRPAFGAPILELNDVSRAFGGLKAVEGVTLSVPEGTIYGIIGPNGAGKTTLFNVLNGFLAADRGTMRFAGQEIGKLKPHEVCARGVGRTFQVVRSFPRMTVLENVVIGAFVGSKTDDEAERLAMEALARVGMADHQAHMLAGGLTTRQLRLMELARALAPKPRLLLLDETLAGPRAERARRRAAGDPARQPRRRDDRDHRTHDARDGEARGSFQRARSRPADRERRAGRSHQEPRRDRSLSRQEVDGPC